MKCMKSISSKLIVSIVPMVAIIILLLGAMAMTFSYTSTMNSLNASMQASAKLASTIINQKFETYRTVTSEIGSIARLSSDDTTTEEKRALIKQKVDEYIFISGNITDINGKGLLEQADISGEDYFKQAMQGKSVVSEMTMNKALGKFTVQIAAPLWEKGIPKTRVAGVVYFIVDAEFLSEIANSIVLGKTGNSYMLNKNGDTIAHKNAQLIAEQSNTIAAAKTDKKLEKLASIEQKMIKQESGFDICTYDGISKLMAYCPVGINDWSVAITAEKHEFFAIFNQMLIGLGIIVAAALIISTTVVLKISRGLSKPIVEVEKAAKELSKGNLKAQIHYTSCDEIGSLAESMRQSMKTLALYVNDIDRAMGEMANGNFNVKPGQPFIGDFKNIENSIGKMVKEVSGTLNQINAAADQVSAGSEQVSSGAQALAQGATEQASSVEELSASITEITQQVNKNAENANTANEMSQNSAMAIANSNEGMQKLMEAMNDINSKSSEISKIIKTIEDIAFQTNILALNAAVEAARAGQAGKGFAVVADEVRNLATKSSEAAKNTTTLIEASIHAINSGVKLADETAQKLLSVVEGANATTQIMSDITKATNEQAYALSQVAIGVDQISGVVQTNSATSEESAAASEELSSQAVIMKELILRFKLLSEDDVIE